MENQICEWKEFPKNMNNQLHTMCSYMAMFPPSLPHYFIDEYSDEGDIVLDPFIGSGTAAVAACKLGRHYIGIDTLKEYCAMSRGRLKETIKFEEYESIESKIGDRVRQREYSKVS